MQTSIPWRQCSTDYKSDIHTLKNRVKKECGKWSLVFYIASRFFTIWDNKENPPINLFLHLNSTYFLKPSLIEMLGLPRWLSGKECACQYRKSQRCGFDSWVGKIPLSRKWKLAPVFLPGKFHGQRNLEGYSPWGCRVRHNWATKQQRVKHNWVTMHLCTHTHVHAHAVINAMDTHQWYLLKIPATLIH